ncbi:MIB/HERC2 domain-containing protein [Entamoeba marina]
MTSDQFDLDGLMTQISALTNALSVEQKDVTLQLEEYEKCRKESIGILSEWDSSQPKPASVYADVEIPEEEQYKKSVNWIFMKRVVQGRDWCHGRSDQKKTKGVVFSAKTNGTITVRWDDGEKTHCRWGEEGCYDVKAVSNKLDMTPVSRDEQVNKPISWLVGRIVKRGRDWKWSDQDGGQGKTGIAVSSAGRGWINVKWGSGSVNQYRWGNDDCYDVEAIF